MDNTELLELAASLAEAAGREILAVRAGGFTVDRKSDQSPVTLADMRAERVIVAGLRAATPDIPVIAEEEVAAGRMTDPGEKFWLVDPLDGTREFAAGRDEFAVCVGLVVNGRAVLGAVGAPAQGAVYGGIVGHGAWRQDAAGRQPISARTPPHEGITVYASRHYADDPLLAEYLARYKVAHLTNIGSALKFCRLAEGVADFYPRLGRTMEWDTAAPQALLEAAGGRVVTMNEQQMHYGKPGFENPHFLCFGRG
ncbi:MAG: 3'(2'),5'-bisphosphate nucleotidase CysQ [Acidiphilium sp.]|nr:3'(2'),5'-bisphosphate nucleotidase CysQ [Acidiphilium sp.]MDD4934989.1 3'(2'),5'-bisphosphate nucleotidase CysQ [Acidiphilium sp.]